MTKKRRVVAVILAGGVGSRMKAVRPKQFLVVNRKPIIVSTISNFERNRYITDVLVVCVSGWIPYFQNLVSRYHLSKVKWVIPGGTTGHDSASNAMFFLNNFLRPDDYVVIHDAARPLLPQSIINKMLFVSFAHGNACCALPCHETLLFTEDQVTGTNELSRKNVMRVQTPQSYRFGDLFPLYLRAREEGRHDFVYADTMAAHYGMTIYFSDGFDNNIKITTPEDIALYKSLSKFSERQLVK
jgi:2-C-methyl-D-erythritol 4-phosphate cytidylyltransferase